MARKPQRKFVRRNPVAKALREPQFRAKIVPAKESYDRKNEKKTVDICITEE